MENICSIKGVTKNYPGVKALDNVSFDIRKGEVHAIVGENGAGKSTLMKTLSGVIQPDKGYIIFNGEKVKYKDTRHAQDLGVAMIHQELSLSNYMSVAENIFQGRMPKNKIGLIDQNKMVSSSKELLIQLGIHNINPKTLVGNLSVSQMQLVEVAKAISLEAKMLIMDEPTSSLTTGEIEKLLEIMRMLVSEGVSILFITHKLEEVMEISDRISVLRDGTFIQTLNKKETNIQQIVSLMVGRELNKKMERQFINDYSTSKAILEVDNLSIDDRVKNISFKLHQGEVLGLTGLVGAGRSELLEGIFGIGKITTGHIKLNGNKVNIKHPKDAIKLGMAMVPEGRKEQGVFLEMNVRDNMTLVHLKELRNKLSLINGTAENNIANEYVKKLAIKTPNLYQKVENLSGGNQQKTILARWLMHNPKILFLDEPTHGIDIGAKSEIYQMIDDLSKRGISIILLSSELGEVLSLCDRIMVMHDGKAKGILDNKEADQVKIMNLTLE